MRNAFLAILISLSSACGPTLSPSAALSPDTTGTSNASGPRISPPPVTPPTPPGTNLPDFACTDWSGGSAGKAANVITARAAEQSGYDRFVLQFDPIVPTYTVKRQDKPVFTMGGSGQTVTLSGTSGVLVTVHSATGVSTFTGSPDLVNANYQVLAEARQTQDYEGYVSWGLGLNKPACLRVFTLNDPARLVVDFRTGGS